MRIRSVHTRLVNYPVEGRFKFFENRSGQPSGRLTVLVEVTSEEGSIGWGQCVPSPRWSYETVETVQSTIEHYLAPVLVGEEACDLDALHARMDQEIAPSFSTGQPICKAGIDLALLDLVGKAEQRTLAERWGRAAGGPVTMSWTLNPRTLAEAETSLQEASDRGYSHFNIKVGPDVQFDSELCRLAREHSPEGILWADANGGYDLDAALQAAPRLAELGLIALEQPLPGNRLGGLQRLVQQGALPIVLDEPLVSLMELREFHRLGMLNGAAIKVARCGGLSEAVRQVEYLREHDLLVLGSGLTDPDFSLAASAHLFSAFDFPYPVALNGPQYLRTSILRVPLRREGDQLFPPGGTGLGVEPDFGRIPG